MLLQQFASPSEALEHHGVKGMRWGVRKEESGGGSESGGRISGASKPGDAPGVDKKQRRIAKFEARSEVMNTRISELKAANASLAGAKSPAQLYTRSTNKQTIKQLEKEQARAVRDAEAVKQGKLTSTQKKAIIGGVAVAAMIGGGLVASKYIEGQQSGAINSWMLQGKAFATGQKVPFKINKDLTKAMSADELLKAIAKPVNPGYSSAGGKMNCRRSTYAYELRRRGFDVHATTSAVGWGQSESGVINALTTKGKDYFHPTSMSQTVVETGFSSVAKGDTRVTPAKKILLDGLQERDLSNPFSEPRSTSKRVLSELAKQPNGARGEVLFKFPGFGHSMAYEIVDGVPHIFDSQKGTLYNASHAVESKWDGFSAAEITRLDNMDLDLNFLTRWATNNRG